MRIARALVISALSLGLTATLAQAQAAPPDGSQVAAPVQVAAKKAATKLTAKVSAKKVTVGKTVTYTGILKRKTSRGYKPYGKQMIYISVDAGAEVNIAATGKTSKHGKFTIKMKARAWMIGDFDTMVSYQGNPTSGRSSVDHILIKVAATEPVPDGRARAILNIDAPENYDATAPVSITGTLLRAGKTLGVGYGGQTVELQWRSRDGVYVKLSTAETTSVGDLSMEMMPGKFAYDEGCFRVIYSGDASTAGADDVDCVLPIEPLSYGEWHDRPEYPSVSNVRCDVDGDVYRYEFDANLTATKTLHFSNYTWTGDYPPIIGAFGEDGSDEIYDVDWSLGEPCAYQN